MTTMWPLVTGCSEVVGFFFTFDLLGGQLGVVSTTRGTSNDADVSDRAKEGEGDGGPPGFTHEGGPWWCQRGGGGPACPEWMDDSRNAKLDHDYQRSTWSPNLESDLMWSLASLPSSFSGPQAEKWLHPYTPQLCPSSWYRNLPQKLLRLPECRGIVLYLWVDTVWTFFLVAQRLSGWAGCHNCVVNELEPSTQIRPRKIHLKKTPQQRWRLFLACADLYKMPMGEYNEQMCETRQGPGW